MNIPTWENLEVFTITSATGTTNVYPNGRQQAKLRITLQAVDINGQPVPLTQKELNSLRLVDNQGRPIADDPLDYELRSTDPSTLARQQYDPDEYARVAAGRVGFDPVRHDRLQFNKYRRNFNEVNWMWSRVHNRDYQFFPRAPGERDPEPEFSQAQPYTYIVDVYIRTISRTPLNIAVQLTRGDGQHFFSHALNRNQGMLRVNPVTLPGYAATDYRFPRSVIYGNVESTQFFDSLDYYEFRLVSNQTHIEFLRFDMQPLSIRRDAISPKDRGSITGFTYPGDDYLNFGMALRDLPGKLVENFKERGKVYICLARQARFRTVPGGVDRDSGVSKGPSTIRALDMYGNDHQVRLQFKGNGRKYLELV